jgi:hypothetical protein
VIKGCNRNDFVQHLGPVLVKIRFKLDLLTYCKRFTKYNNFRLFVTQKTINCRPLEKEDEPKHGNDCGDKRFSILSELQRHGGRAEKCFSESCFNTASWPEISTIR